MFPAMPVDVFHLFARHAMPVDVFRCCLVCFAHTSNLITGFDFARGLTASNFIAYFGHGLVAWAGQQKATRRENKYLSLAGIRRGKYLCRPGFSLRPIQIFFCDGCACARSCED